MTSRRARNFADYSSVARRRKLILIVPMFILAASTAIALKALPNLYESTARLRLTSVKTDTAPDLSVHIREFRDRLTASETLAMFVREENPRADSSESLISPMRTRVFVQADSASEAQPGAFTVSYRATDPETAQRITADLASRLVTLDSKEPSLAASEVEVLRKRAAEISVQLRQLEANAPWLQDVRSDLSGAAASLPPRVIQPSPEAVRDQQMTIDGLKDQQYKIQQQLSDLDKRIALQRQIVEQQKKGSVLRDNPTYAVLIAKRTELQGQRDTLINRQELTDKHPRVLAITDQIAAINRQIEELRQQDTTFVSQTPEARELASIESERNRLRIELEVAGRELARRSTGSAIPSATIVPSPVRRSGTSSKLTQQYQVLKRGHQDATNELQTAEARQARENGASPQVSLLEPADLPSRPLLPSRLLLISIAAVVGLVLGFGFAMCAESRRLNSLQNARDVEYYTRLPLLAAIPATATAGERRRARWRAAVRFTLATATSVIATLVLTRIFAAADIFALIIGK